MTDLATQIEQAGPEQQREMLEAAWEHILGDEPGYYVSLVLLDIGTDEAFAGAALMLLKEGSLWSVACMEDGPIARLI